MQRWLIFALSWLGSSLTVTPANSIPEIVSQREGARLAICNLQTAPIDHLTNFRISSKKEPLMTKMMEKLNLPISPFVQPRHLVVNVETQEEERHRVTATLVDTDGTPMTFLHSVRLEGSRLITRAEFSIILVRESLQPRSQLNLNFEFMCHYDEPNLEVFHEFNGDEEALYVLETNLKDIKRTVAKHDGLADATGSFNIDPWSTWAQLYIHPKPPKLVSAERGLPCDRHHTWYRCRWLSIENPLGGPTHMRSCHEVRGAIFSALKKYGLWRHCWKKKRAVLIS